MKKLVVLMLAGMMSAAMVTGCGSSSADTAAPAEAEETDAAADEAEAADTEDAAADEAEAADTADSDLAYVQDKGTLVVGITEFEPMDYKDESGEWVGFDADMAKAFAKSLGVEAEFVVIDWDNKILELDGKTIDCVWNGMTLTDEVTSAMECTNPYQDEASLADLSFAVETGSAGEAEVSALGLNYTPVAAQSDALMEVAAGTSDAAVIDSLMAGAMVGEGTGYENLTYTIGLNSEEYGVGFRKGSDLAQALNDFFKTSSEDGSLQACAEQYGVQAALIQQ